MMYWIKRVLSAPFVGAAALVIAFSEWLWNPLLKVIAKLARLPPIQMLENQIRQLPSWAALLMFAIPAIALLPFKLAGLYLIAHGKKILGTGVFLAAKVVGTGLLAWIYSLTEPALARYQWFVKARAWYRSAKEWLYAQVKSSFIWQKSKSIIHNTKAQLTRFFKRK